ncbi:hypothetical protein PsYK624_080220 [Phanerochaete sordida]|uniref:Uncharacterized protein n=1 Tax=Phanerochaete sordida TaxID=48140 RepID=A0A9P3LDU7_9APHY|nr:hypothetical protein PsYK624_080220 [Phanerochaete sordida]
MAAASDGFVKAQTSLQSSFEGTAREQLQALRSELDDWKQDCWDAEDEVERLEKLLGVEDANRYVNRGKAAPVPPSRDLEHRLADTNTATANTSTSTDTPANGNEIEPGEVAADGNTVPSDLPDHQHATEQPGGPLEELNAAVPVPTIPMPPLTMRLEEPSSAQTLAERITSTPAPQPALASRISNATPLTERVLAKRVRSRSPHGHDTPDSAMAKRRRPVARGAASMWNPHQRMELAGGGTLIPTGYETWGRYCNFEDLEQPEDPIDISIPRCIEPPNPSYEHVDIERFRKPGYVGEMTRREHIRFPRDADELYAVMALALRPNNYLASRIVGWTIDYGLRRDEILTPFVQTLTRAIHWCKPNWMGTYRARTAFVKQPKGVRTNPGQPVVDDEDEQVDYDDDYDDLANSEVQRTFQPPPLLPSVPEITFDDPPRFKLKYFDYWVEWLQRHPKCPIINVQRDAHTGRVLNANQLRGFLAVGEMGPVPHIGIRAMHWIYCVARLQRIFGILSNFRWVEASHHFDPKMEVTDDTVKAYLLTSVIPTSHKLERPPESDPLADARAEGLRVWAQTIGPPREILPVPRERSPVSFS